VKDFVGIRFALAEYDDSIWHREARAKQLAGVRGLGTDAFAVCERDLDEAKHGVGRFPSGHLSGHQSVQNDFDSRGQEWLWRRAREMGREDRVKD
jgi:hypothetical protein